MSFICNFCNNTFAQKIGLQRHIIQNRCISDIFNDHVKINELIQEKNILIEKLKTSIVNINGNDNNNINGDHNIINNVNIKIEINPITKLDVSHIAFHNMKMLIETYDDNKNPDRLNIVLADYIKEILCSDKKLENHAVKYIKKHPPTYNTCIEDIDGNTVSVIKGLKDTCELLSDPILNKLKKKMIEFCRKYHKDDLPEFDYTLYENAIKELKKELNKSNVKRALNSVLKNDILNNIEMKLTKPHISPPKINKKNEINSQV